MRSAKQFLTYVSSGPFQYAVAEALALPDAYFTAFREDMLAKRNLLSAGLADAGFEVFRTAGTYFVTTDIRPLRAVRALQADGGTGGGGGTTPQGFRALTAISRGRSSRSSSPRTSPARNLHAGGRMVEAVIPAHASPQGATYQWADRVGAMLPHTRGALRRASLPTTGVAPFTAADQPNPRATNTERFATVVIGPAAGSSNHATTAAKAVRYAQGESPG